MQATAFNWGRIDTVVAVILTSSMRLLDAPGNTLVTRRAGSLQKDSVANVSQIVTIDRSGLVERSGRIPPVVMKRVDRGLRLLLELPGEL
jgi:mRNA interferase MazF